MYCQACGALNEIEREFCWRCQQKLLVLSGQPAEEAAQFEESGGEEEFSLDEHLLERISILEEAMKRTAQSLQQLVSALTKQERNILVNQVGVVTIRDLLEHQGLLDGEEWGELWRRRMDRQLLALEKRERFSGMRERIAAHFRGQRRSRFLELLDDAEYALLAMDVERAVAVLEEAFQLDRSNYELAYFLGETCFNEGDSESALRYLSQVLKAKPDHYEALVYSGVVRHELGDGGTAKALLKQAVGIYPDAFLPQFSLGAVHAGEGRLPDAVAHLERAVSIERVPQALFILGSCYYEMGKNTAAIRSLREVVRHDPAYEEAYHLLGLAYLARGWNRKALDAFRQAQQLNPKRMRYQDLVRYLSGKSGPPLPEVNREAKRWLRRAEGHLAANRAEAALEAYRTAVQADPENPTLLLSYAMACLQLDRNRETQDLSRRVLELEPEPGEILKATACATLIEALRSEGRFREGNRIGRRLLGEGAGSFARTIAYCEMAYNLAEMEEDLDEALDYARKSLDLAPEELRQFPLATLGWVHYKRREFPQAVEYLQLSSDLGPSATTLTHLGMAQLAAGSEEKARTTLARARELESTAGGSLGQQVMECLKDSSRLLQGVQDRSRRQAPSG